MISKKQKRKLLKKTTFKSNNTNSYIAAMQRYSELFQDFPNIKFLINNVLQSDRLIAQKLLPQSLPELLLPDDIQDQVFNYINAHYQMGDPKGDQLWDQLSAALPKLDAHLRSFRDYLENQYGMWAYISAPFVKDLAAYLKDKTALEIMAGNGYISNGLNNLGVTVYPTDSLEWTKENQTGNQAVTTIEKLDALAAIDKYQDQIDAVIMCWSPDGLPIDVDVLNALRNLDHQVELIVIGEPNGATNSSEFWQLATPIKPEITSQLNQHHQPFDLIHDQVFIMV